MLLCVQSVEKAFVADVCAATRDVKFDEATLNGVRCPILTRRRQLHSALSTGGSQGLQVLSSLLAEL